MPINHLHQFRDQAPVGPLARLRGEDLGPEHDFLGQNLGNAPMILVFNH